MNEHGSLETELVSVEIRTAAKPHKCRFCGAVINQGEKLMVEKIKYQKKIFERKRCEKCLTTELDA